MDTTAIVEKVLQGDVDTFGQIITRYQVIVWHIAACMLKDRDATEDLVQQVFVAAYRSLDTYRRQEDFEKWLKGIARNVIRMELRRRVRESMRLRQHEEKLLASVEGAERAEEQAARLRDIVADCVQTLSEPSQAILDCRYKQGMDFRQIAAQLRRSVEAVRQALFRIRETLRECADRKLAET